MVERMGIVAIVAACCLAMACQSTGPEEPMPDQADEETQVLAQGDDDEPGRVEPSADSEALLALIDGYESWEYHAGLDSHTASGHPGDIWVIAYANEEGVEMVEQQQVPAPAGTIFVKEEYDADGAAEPVAVTVMQKLSDEQGDWYWLKTDPDLQSVVETPDGVVLEGTEDLGCIGCHAAEADQDYVMTPQFGN